MNICEKEIMNICQSSQAAWNQRAVFPGVPGSVRNAEKDPASLKIVHFTVIDAFTHGAALSFFRDPARRVVGSRGRILFGKLLKKRKKHEYLIVV